MSRTTYDDPEDPEEGDDSPEEDEDEQANHPAARVRHISRPAPQLPISETETEATMHGEARFTASVNMGTRDDNRHYSLMLPFAVQQHWTPEEAAVAAATAFFQVKAVIYEQAGIEFTVDEGGVLHETVRKVFPAARRVRDEPPEDREDRPQARQSDDRGSGGRFPHPADMDKPRHVDDDLWADLCETYPDDWYDNRPRKANGEYKSTAADFKRVSDQASIWLKPFRRDGNQGRQGSSSNRGYQR